MTDLVELLLIPKLAVDVLVWLLSGIAIGIAQWHKASKDQWLMLDQVFPLDFELVFHLLRKHILELISILHADQSVLKYS